MADFLELDPHEWESALPRAIEIHNAFAGIHASATREKMISPNETLPCLLSRRIASAVWEGHPQEFEMARIAFLAHRNVDEAWFPSFRYRGARGIAFQKYPYDLFSEHPFAKLTKYLFEDCYTRRVTLDLSIEPYRFQFTMPAREDVFATQFADMLHDSLGIPGRHAFGRNSAADTISLLLRADPVEFARRWSDRMDRYDEVADNLGDVGDEALMVLMNQVRASPDIVSNFNVIQARFGLRPMSVSKIQAWTDAVAAELDLSDELFEENVADMSAYREVRRNRAQPT